MFSALLAIAMLASTSPDSRLALLQNTAAFHLYVMPDSSEVRQVTVLASDPTGKATAVRIVYELSQQTLVVVEKKIHSYRPVARDGNLLYAIAIAPREDYPDYERAFERVVRSIQLADNTR